MLFQAGRVLAIWPALPEGREYHRCLVTTSYSSAG